MIEKVAQDVNGVKELNPKFENNTRENLNPNFFNENFSKKDVSESTKENLNPKFHKEPLINKDDLCNNTANENLIPKFREEREKIEKNSPYSKDVNDNIKSEEELEVYKKANLKEGEVNGKKNLERTDIDYEQVDEDGKTNLNRMKEGKAPLDKEGNPIELHHIGQKSDSPLAELTKEEHRGKNNNTILHDVNKESEIDRDKFNKERSDYWKERAKQVEAQVNS